MSVTAADFYSLEVFIERYLSPCMYITIGVSPLISLSQSVTASWIRLWGEVARKNPGCHYEFMICYGTLSFSDSAATKCGTDDFGGNKMARLSIF